MRAWVRTRVGGKVRTRVRARIRDRVRAREWLVPGPGSCLGLGRILLPGEAVPELVANLQA